MESARDNRSTVVNKIKAIYVVGSQRLEPDTVRSYVKLRPGRAYNSDAIDEAIRDLIATELFADAQILDDNGVLTISVRENPIINRIVFEGNKCIKEDKLSKELKHKPRQIFNRSNVRADADRIVQLYRRQGRFTTSVEPMMVTLDQNRVDIVYEISEGPKSKVRSINIIGNEVFNNKKLKGEMATKESSITHAVSACDPYDPDRLAYDQQKLRQFYLTNGYADFRVVSAVAELTPDKRDFILTYVIEEGTRYKFGDVEAESEILDLKPEKIKAQLPMKTGDWFDAKLVEDTVENLAKTAGLFGYGFVSVEPVFNRNAADRTMNIVFRIGETPRVYTEQETLDKALRREFRLAEGDALNRFSVKRSQDRIKSLGYFSETFEIVQREADAPDRIVLEANVEEKLSGEDQLLTGFSSLERFILNASIHYREKGQEIRALIDVSDQGSVSNTESAGNGTNENLNVLDDSAPQSNPHIPNSGLIATKAGIDTFLDRKVSALKTASNKPNIMNESEYESNTHANNIDDLVNIDYPLSFEKRLLSSIFCRGIYKELQNIIAAERCLKFDDDSTRRNVLARSLEAQLEPLFNEASYPETLRSTFIDKIIDEILSYDVSGREPWAARVVKDASIKRPSVESSQQPLPETAPALWKIDKQPGDTPPDFIKRHYGQWLRADALGLTRPDIKRLDPRLYMALANWLRKNDLPDDCPVPIKSERVNAEVSQFLQGGIGAAMVGTAIPQNTVREAQRLASAIQRRR